MAHGTAEGRAGVAAMAIGLAIAGCQPPRVCPGGVAPVDGLCPVSCAVLGSCGGGPDASHGGDATADGASADGDAADTGPAAPRLVAPISVATVTTQRPTLHWDLPAGASGAHARVCSDRAMTQRCQSVDAPGTSGRVTTALGHGVWFWRAWGVTAGVVGSAGSATWEFIVPARDSSVDSVRGSAMDINGDGYADLAVGAPMASMSTGIIDLFVATPTGLMGGVGSFTGSRMSAQLGASIAAVGDLNGDGWADLLAGEPGADGGGDAYFYPSRGTNVSLPSPDGAAAAFGGAVASGDFDGDGRIDALIGAPQTAMAAGRVYFYPASALVAGSAPSVPLNGAGTAGAQFGLVIASGADVDGDGFDDAIIGAPGSTGVRGAVHVVAGSASGPAAAHATSIDDPDDLAARFGSAVATGDLNGDGFDDVAVGSPGANGQAGRVHVYPGSASGLQVSRVVVIDAPDSGAVLFGAALAIGDIDGDGLADLIVGAPLAAGGLGRIHVYAGQDGAIGTVVTWSLDNPDRTGVFLFGEPVAAIGDVNGDGYGDVAVGAGGDTANPHAVFVFVGGATGLGSSPIRVDNPTPMKDDRFGHSIAFSVRTGHHDNRRWYGGRRRRRQATHYIFEAVNL